MVSYPIESPRMICALSSRYAFCAIQQVQEQLSLDLQSLRSVAEFTGTDWRVGHMLPEQRNLSPVIEGSGELARLDNVIAQIDVDDELGRR